MLTLEPFQYYKHLVLKKMTKAFEPGDPVLELAALGQGHPNTVLEEDEEPWLRKAEQLKIDEVRTFESQIFPICTTVQVVSSGVDFTRSSTTSELRISSNLCLGRY